MMHCMSCNLPENLPSRLARHVSRPTRHNLNSFVFSYAAVGPDRLHAPTHGAQHASSLAISHADGVALYVWAVRANRQHGAADSNRPATSSRCARSYHLSPTRSRGDSAHGRQLVAGGAQQDCRVRQEEHTYSGHGDSVGR